MQCYSVIWIGKLLAEGSDGYPPWPGGTVGFLEDLAYTGDLSIGISKRGGTTLVSEASLLGLIGFCDICIARDINAARPATKYSLVLETLNKSIGTGAAYVIH